MLIMKIWCSGVFQEQVLKTESCISINMYAKYLYNKIPSDIFHTISYIQMYNTISKMHGFLMSNQFVFCYNFQHLGPLSEAFVKKSKLFPTSL